MQRNRRQSWILDSMPWIPDSGTDRYWILVFVNRTWILNFLIPESDFPFHWAIEECRSSHMLWNL